MEVSLDNFLAEYPNNKFYRLTNENEKHHDIEYNTGLNEDVKVFNPSGSCQPGGLYFYIDFQLPGYTKYSANVKWIREVTWTDLIGVRIYLEKGKCKTNKFILGERQEFKDMYKFYTVSLDNLENINNRDRDLVTDDIRGYVKFISPEMLLQTVFKYPTIVKFLPREYLTRDICRTAVMLEGYNLTCVPVDMMSHDVYLAVVLKNGWHLQYVPHHSRSPDICLAAVTRHGHALQFVPDDVMTCDLARVAVIENGDALRCVPVNLRTSEICIIAVARHGYALQYVPDELRTYDLIITAVTRHGGALLYVPTDMKTSEVCLAAVTNYGVALKYVPVDLCTRQICVAAVIQDKEAIRYVPDNISAPEIDVYIAKSHQYD